MRKFLFVSGVLACMLAFGTMAAHAQQVTLDNAVRNTAWGLANGMESGSRVAVLAIQADSARMSDYLIGEMIVALTGLQAVQGFTVMPRSQMNQLLGGLPVRTSDLIDNAMAQRIGRVLDVQFVVTGSFESIAGFFRFRVQAVEVETANVTGIQTADVQNDTLVAYFMGTGTQGQAGQAGQTRPAAPPRRPATIGRANWFSGGIGGSAGSIGGFNINAQYQRDINEIFSLGAAAFLNLHRDIDFGIAFSTRLFPGGSPFYFGLDAGFGALSYWRWESWGSWGSDYFLDWNIGVLITPSIGLRLGGQAAGFFWSPFISVPIVIGTGGGHARFQPGVALGGAW